MAEGSFPRVPMTSALALITLCTLSLEIMLTRLFSVTMMYHFAFLAISIAMFGMALGAVIVYLLGSWFLSERLPHRLAGLSLAFGISIPPAVCAVLYVPSPPTAGTSVTNLLLIYGALLVPFTFSGILVSAVLTALRKGVAVAYAADLFGAAAGCLVVFILLNWLDGPTALLTLSLAPVAAAFLFLCASSAPGPSPLRRTTWVILLALVALVASNAQWGYIRVYWQKNFDAMIPEIRRDLLLERWNSMSRVTVYRKGGKARLGWGMSDRLDEKAVRPKRYSLRIDNEAETPIIEFKGDLEPMGFLRYDVTALAYRLLRPGSSVAIIGAGGCKDVLTAMLFGSTRVLGIEINRNIIRAVHEDFGEFSGHLDRRPNVHIELDEARSYLARNEDAYDLIQASLIDTWAANAAGAFALTENGLYTREAWALFCSRLRPDGYLTFSRWWNPGHRGEMLRLANIAVQTLLDAGVANPGSHLFIARQGDAPGEPVNTLHAATLILSRRPLFSGEVATLRSACDEMGFQVLTSPDGTGQEEFVRLVNPLTREAFISSLALDLSPPVDDRPFFFNMIKPWRAFSLPEDGGLIYQTHTSAIRLVLLLLASLAGLTGFLILLPLTMIQLRHGQGLGGAISATLYFSGIGLGFMCIEMGQIERLGLFLGHPTYSLVLVLTSLLLSAGLGSMFSGRWIGRQQGVGKAPLLYVGFLLSLSAFVWASPEVLTNFQASTTPVRLLVACLLVSLPGFLMGIPFPAGMARAALVLPHHLPWLWGLNGACSVTGSVLALLLSIGFGITNSMWVGVAAYVLGLPFLLTTGDERATGPAIVSAR